MVYVQYMRHVAAMVAFVSGSMHAVRVLCEHNNLPVHVSYVQPIKLDWCANINLRVQLMHTSLVCTVTGGTGLPCYAVIWPLI